MLSFYARETKARRGTPRPLSRYLLFLISLDVRLIQYDASIHSFFYSFFHIVNSLRAPSPYSLGSKNSYGPCPYEAYSLVGNKLIIK